MRKKNEKKKRIILSWIMDLNVKKESVKFLEQNVENILVTLG